MSKSKEDVSKTDIAMADKVTMDSFVRTMISQMFENDNDTATLEVVLNDTNTEKDPCIELEVRLVSINGVKTRKDNDGND